MNKSTFIEYAELQSQIKELEIRKKNIAKKCINKLKKDGLQRLDDDLGVFSLMERKTYKYSDKIKKLEENIKIVKEVEQNEGIAKVTVFETLRFLSKKNED